jgi:hypothetical protein
MCVAVALLFRVHSEVTEEIKSVPKGKQEWIKK